MNDKDIQAIEHIIRQMLTIDEQKQLFMRFKDVMDVLEENERLNKMLDNGEDWR